MTGRIVYPPEAKQHLRILDEWIAQKSSEEAAENFLSRVLEHIESILVFPLAGRSRDDLRQGIRTTAYRGRTVVAYAVANRKVKRSSRFLGSSMAVETGETALNEDEDQSST